MEVRAREIGKRKRECVRQAGEDLLACRARGDYSKTRHAGPGCGCDVTRARATLPDGPRPIREQ